MEWQANWEGPLQSYLQRFDGLLGDARTRRTFQESIKGILAAGTLICQRIAACSAMLAQVRDESQRIIRLATGESTKRSQVDAEHLTAQLREVAVEQIAQAPEDEVWLIADGSDLRKPYNEAMPALMQVRDLDDRLVPGYRMLNVLGITPGRRGILYHRLFSSQELGFVSEPAEVQQALEIVSQAVAPLRAGKQITWILDRGLDDIAVWRTIWQEQDHLVCRVYHTDRLVEFQDYTGQWHEGQIAQACSHLRSVARAETSLEMQRGKQLHPKQQPVVVDLAACPLRLTYWSNVRRPGGKGKLVTKSVWLVQVLVLGTNWEPWLRLSLPVRRDLGMGRGATARQVRRLDAAQGSSSWQDHPPAWLTSSARRACDSSHPKLRRCSTGRSATQYPRLSARLETSSTGFMTGCQ